jgi:hypothetical protein
MIIWTLVQQQKSPNSCPLTFVQRRKPSYASFSLKIDINSKKIRIFAKKIRF